jgi:molybdate transport system ATP-binding protein
MSVDIRLRHAFKGFALDVDFAVGPGVTALFGPSGAGKTTIANAVAGLIEPDAGRIVLNGNVVLATESKIFVPARARRTGYVFQDARLFPHMSVENNLRFGWRRRDPRASEADIAHIVDLLGLAPLLHRRPAKLSGGEKSRVALARALLAAPEILILDEPLAALDAARKREILPYLERLRDEARIPMLYVSHAVDEVARLADHLVVLKEGRVAAEGSIFDLISALEFSDITGASPYGAVIGATVSSHSDADGLTQLAFPGGSLTVTKLSQAIGAPLRVRIRAEDVMLAREEPRAISANNVLPARIEGVRLDTQSHADIRLDCGGTKILARITQASLKRLALEPGAQVFAIVKSVTVDSPLAASRD